jgi:2,3-bisphosphoglycerate-independent phosphoglycerate mutase
LIFRWGYNLLKHSPKPTVLCILDGWGIGKHSKYNAISSADTPFWDGANRLFPKSEILTSGEAVGLPNGQMGNSEVGHMNIGSGRVILQDLPKINNAIKDGSYENKELIKQTIKQAKELNRTVHIIGLLSDGGVHSHIDHISATIKLFSKKNVEVKLHAFLDGRDVSPKSADQYFKTSDIKNSQIATISGRFYSMDRDQRWDRTKYAYDAIVSAKGNEFTNYKDCLEHYYDRGVTDEFISPSVIAGYEGIQGGDILFVVNFRSDRIKQILSALIDPEFSQFERENCDFSKAVSLVEYSKELSKHIDAVFETEQIKHTLGEVISQNGLRQLRIAETEKHAHVTYFFNAGIEGKFEGEERIMIPSPKVKIYDQQPEMSAFELTERLNSEIKENKFDVIIVNFANADMVGHTGNFAAAKKAVETIDKCLESIYAEISELGGALVITADHGNVELMYNESAKQHHTSHTLNPVPFLICMDIKDTKKKFKINNGRLCDIAPTILDLLGLEKPKEMTGKTLITD